MALFGPTGMGKTEIAIALAELLNGEVVSADSMQVYRGLPIVTNQPSAEQLARVPHHLVSVIDVDEEFSVALYADLALAAVDDIRGRGRAALVVGGSGLYLRAALGGLSLAGKSTAADRRRLEALASTDPEALRERLRRADPETFGAIDNRNPRRVVRALECLDARLAEPGRPATSFGPTRDSATRRGYSVSTSIASGCDRPSRFVSMRCSTGASSPRSRRCRDRFRERWLRPSACVRSWVCSRASSRPTRLARA